MKLFVWHVIANKYPCGILFALAPDVETARELLLKEDSTIASDLKKEPSVFDEPVAYTYIE